MGFGKYLTRGKGAGFAIVTTWWANKVFEDNKFTTEDIPATLQAGGMIAGIIGLERIAWSGVGWVLSQPATWAIAIPVIVGGVLSHMIDEDEGLDNYIDFLLEPEKMLTRTEESVKIIEKEVINPYIETTTHQSLQMMDIFALHLARLGSNPDPGAYNSSTRTLPTGENIPPSGGGGVTIF